jgi:D-alanyl-D-alanine carboxypeptidase (penicillin-binding protein 5/6)
MIRGRRGRPERVGPLTTSGLRRRRERIAAAIALLAAALVWAVVGLLVLNPGGVLDRGQQTASRAGRRPPVPRPPTSQGTDTAPASRFAVAPASEPTPVSVRLRPPPKAGVLFDVRTGRVLWELHPQRRLPIASLTKMMTALIVVERHRPRERVTISKRATHTPGSGVGVLKRGHRALLESLLDGLLLVSGNDAAVALAQHDSGSTAAFVRRMNRRGEQLGLRCSRFDTPNGLRDRGNYSCPVDLATLARADLAEPRIARIARSDHLRFPFPIRGGYLDLYNNNPFIRLGAKGITGLKTGYTIRAGRCYVITLKRGARELGVVLLNSPDPIGQVNKLLKAGLRAGG